MPQQLRGDDVTNRTNCQLGPDVSDGDTLRDGADRVVDDAYVDAAVEDAIAEVRGRGRPSSSATGESLMLRVRISRELHIAIRRAATAAGTSRPEWVRRVLDDSVRQTG